VKSLFSKLCLASALVLGTSTAAFADDSRYIIQVDNSKKGIVKALARQMGGELNLDADGFFAATFDGKNLSEVRGLLKNPHIKLIEEDSRRFPLAIYNDTAGDPTITQLIPYAIVQSQADQLTLDLTSNQKVCVIDSGIARETGETGGGNNDFDWSVITGDNDSGTGDWFRDGGPHGTHVAGTVGAADNGFGVIGLAPGVPMHIIKVFNASGWGYSSNLALAAQLCGNANSTIITMSLGGGGANSTEENAFIDFTNNGGLVLAAAGNDGNSARSYPAGYKSVMMIGANDNNNNIASFSQFPSNTRTTGRGRNRVTETDDGFGVEVTAGGVDTLSTYPAGGATVASLMADGAGFAASAMENSGTASGSTYFMGLGTSTDSGANGKICVIDRGEISFQDKVANCENSGGLGAVIINNVAGMLYGTLGSPNNTSIPAVGAALEDRGDIVAASSASVSVSSGDYGMMSGTSMATPAAAGAAALIWSNHPTCTGTQIRDAMKATAEDQGAAGRDDYFGYGIVKAKAASDYLTANGCGGGTPNVAPTASFTFSCSALSCDFDGSGSSDSDGSVVSYSWDFGDGNSASGATASHTYAADGTYEVTLTVTDDAGATGSSNQNVSVNDGGGTGGVFNLSVNTYKVKGVQHADLTWGNNSGNVDIYRDGVAVKSNVGGSMFTDNIGNKGGGVYVYQVCNTGTNTCSNSVNAVF